MTEPAITWTAVAMAGVASAGAWIRIIMDNRKTKENNNKYPSNKGEPGKTELCIQRGERIVKLETDSIWIKQHLEEIYESVNVIKQAVLGRK